MSKEYDQYIADHKRYVCVAFNWLKDNLPGVIGSVSLYGSCIAHDQSKYDVKEYDAYDAYFYGGHRTQKVKDGFKLAWLHHIHNNPHHWQHWVLINDEPNEGTIALEMDYEYVIEMICDWWAFSHKSGNLYEIFDWYDKHKSNMILHENTRDHVERILAVIKNKLDSIK